MMRCLLITIASISVLFAGALIAGVAGYRINATNSLPPGIWHVDELTVPVRRGDVVSACLPETELLAQAKARDYVSAGLCPGWTEPLFKPVAAIAGDVVTIDGNGIRVNDRLVPNSIAQQIDGRGARLDAVEPGIYVVAPEQAWLVSSYNRWSFDSRYFGPVSVRSIQGIAHAVIVADVPEQWR
jgi:conjugative transfer signal peptidase TraF